MKKILLGQELLQQGIEQKHIDFVAMYKRCIVLQKFVVGPSGRWKRKIVRRLGIFES